MRILPALISNERGASTIEYAFLASLIAVAISGAIISLGDGVTGSYNSTESKIADARN
jgi:Flp pilus assembly pilin Flp